MKRGFTLIELMVVIAIIGILAAFIVTQLSGSREQARISQAKATAVEIGKALTVFNTNEGYWPADVNRGIDPGVVTKPSTLPSWSGPYLAKWTSTTPWDGMYDYNNWPTGYTRGSGPSCTYVKGIYVGIVSIAQGDPTGQPPPSSEAQMKSDHFDACSTTGIGEIQFLAAPL